MKVSDNTYDIVFAGGGAAAMMLLYQLVKLREFQSQRILVIDRQLKKGNDRTWSFWTNEETEFDEIACKTWKNVRFTSKFADITEQLESLTYKTIRGEDFFQFVYDKLSDYQNIDWIEAEIKETGGDQDASQKGFVVLEDGRKVEARYVFNSLFKLSDLPRGTKHHVLLQHFYGQVVRTKEPFFDDTTIQLFDMRIPQEGAVQFVYILPFSSTKALIEYTVFSENLFDKEVYKNSCDYRLINMGL